MRRPRQKRQVDIRRNRRVLERRSKNRDSRILVGEGDVDELVESAWSEEGGVDLVGSVGRSDDKDVLLGAHSVHLGLHTSGKETHHQQLRRK